MSRSNSARKKKSTVQVVEKPRAFANPLLGLARLFSDSLSSSLPQEKPPVVADLKSESSTIESEPAPVLDRPAKPRQLRVREFSTGGSHAQVSASEKSITHTEKSFTSSPLATEVPNARRSEPRAKIETEVRRTPTASRVATKSTTSSSRTKHKQDEKQLVFVLGLTSIALGIGLSFGDRITLSDSNVDSVAAARSEFDARGIEERVRYHRERTGMRLNRDRVQVEYDNHLDAPTLSGVEQPVPMPNVMTGLPLAAERHHRDSSRERSEVADPSYAEDRIMYELQDEQAAKNWAISARRAYVKEFIENARRAGYEVKIDKNGVAQIVGKVPQGPRRPALDSSKMDYSKGAVR